MHRWLSLLLCIVSLCLIPVTASAHPGRTDANGGHWDNSTGEYHYHHGYSAHDHYDMNGDGVVDCPYDFVDRTGRNSGTPSGSKTSSSIYEKVPAETVTVYKDREVIKEVPFTPLWVKWIIGILALSVLCLFIGNKWKKQSIKELMRTIENQANKLKQQEETHKLLISSKNNEMHSQAEYLRKRHQSEVENITVQNQKRINSLKEENETLRRELHSVITEIPVGDVFYPKPDSRLYKIEIPKEVYFVDKNIPVKGIVTSYDPFGDFTVFTTKTSPIYHSNKYCGGSLGMDPVHLFDVMSHKRSCFKCGKSYGTTPPEWYSELVALRQYCK